MDFDKQQRANLTTPPGFSVKLSSIPGAGLGAWTSTHLPINNVLGVYDGEEFIDNGEYMYGWIVSIYEGRLGTVHLILPLSTTAVSSSKKL